MIESIEISNVATFGSVAEKIDGLSQLNFFYGSNGTGKTTISRIIADETIFPSCTVKWKNNTKLETLVYNRDFSSQNINDLKGVFTLGEDNQETLQKIETAKKELDEHIQKIETLKKTLEGDTREGGKKGELKNIKEEFKKRCWKVKKDYDKVFYDAFSNVQKHMENFKNKVLSEKTTNTSILESLDDLKKSRNSLWRSAGH